MAAKLHVFVPKN